MNGKSVIPMNDYVLVRRTSNSTIGTIIAVGPGIRHKENGLYIPIALKQGDNVLLPEYGGTKIELVDKSDYTLIRESDILAVLKSAATPMQEFDEIEAFSEN